MGAVGSAAAAISQYNASSQTVGRSNSFTIPLEELRALEVSNTGQLIDALMVIARFRDVEVSDRFELEFEPGSVKVVFERKFKMPDIYGNSILTTTGMSMLQAEASRSMAQLTQNIERTMVQKIEAEIQMHLHNGVKREDIVLEKLYDPGGCEPKLQVRVVK